MIDFVKELKNFVDISFLQNIADNLITKHWLSLPDAEALSQYTDKLPIFVNDYEYLSKIKKQFPNLNDHIKFIKSTKGTWPIHSDTHRKCAINIPIQNTLDTVTKFYIGGKSVEKTTESWAGQERTWFSNEYVTYVKDAEFAYEHILTVPTIVNTFAPHSILNNSVSPRVICSWTYNGTYKDALKELDV